MRNRLPEVNVSDDSKGKCIKINDKKAFVTDVEPKTYILEVVKNGIYSHKGQNILWEDEDGTGR